MADGSDPHASEHLPVRGNPDPVKRFSKPALAALLGASCLLVLGAFAFALRSPDRGGPAAPHELYNTRSKPTADGLAALPATYADVDPGAPVLGPPQPGDLGEVFARAAGIRDGADDPLRDVPEATNRQAARAETEALIQATQLADNARSAPVFFALSNGSAQQVTDAGSANLRAELTAYDPFAALAGIGAVPGQGAFGQDPGHQARKETFLARGSDESIYNPFRLETPASPHQLMAGTLIPATLLTGLNSDLPGQVIAQVTEPVYDTVTGETLLLPQGTRVIGRYDSVIAYGQSRALIIWTRLILPDGSSIRIDNLPGTDGAGYAGLSDRVDHQSWQLAKGIALSTLLAVGSELANDDEDRITRAVREAVQDGADQAGQQIVQRQLGVQPTLTVRPGWRLRILVSKGIILRPYRGE